MYEVLDCWTFWTPLCLDFALICNVPYLTKPTLYLPSILTSFVQHPDVTNMCSPVSFPPFAPYREMRRETESSSASRQISCRT